LLALHKKLCFNNFCVSSLPLDLSELSLQLAPYSHMSLFLELFDYGFGTVFNPSSWEDLNPSHKHCVGGISTGDLNSDMPNLLCIHCGRVSFIVVFSVLCFD
jgi:hypothetical protein